MTAPILFVDTTDLASAVGGDVNDQVVLRLDPTRRCIMRFELELPHADDVEALRYARRAMIREERTRGLEWDEPSMEDAVFTGKQIGWSVLVSQASWCRQKVGELTERAQRAREALLALGT
jgi:hypothetical protein